MKRALAALAAVSATAAITVGTPVGAFAESSPSPAPTKTSAKKPVSPLVREGLGAKSAGPDGYVWVWEDVMWEGRWCGWTGNHNWWRQPENGLFGTPGVCEDDNDSFEDVASSMWNNSYPGSYDDVRFYKHTDNYQIHMCLGSGDDWGNLALGWERFTDGSIANDAISWHVWRNSCP